MPANLPRVEIAAEAAGRWSSFISGLPIAADGATLEEAVLEMIDALRAYAEDWHEYLRDASNHRENRDLVQMIDDSDDHRLGEWISASPRNVN